MTLYTPSRPWATLWSSLWILTLLTSCVSSQSKLKSLSSETLSLMETPLYTQRNVDEAQYILRERAWSAIPPDATLETLKAFSCLVVDQSLDETTARGRKADQTKITTRRDIDISTLIYNRGSYKIVIHTEHNLI